MLPYAATLTRFAKLGAEIYQADPAQFYATIGRAAIRRREPGYIPVDRPARVVTVSYYPNATELSSPEYEASKASFERWGRTGSVDDYTAAYSDWLTMLPQVPFYRDFNAPIFAATGIGVREFAWLPLVKCPLPARTNVPEEDVWRDRPVLWEQLRLLRPRVIVAQGLGAYDVVRPMCEDKFPHEIILQKIGRFGTSEYHQSEDARVVAELREALSRAEAG